MAGMTLTAYEVSGSTSTTNNTSRLYVKLTITTGGSWNTSGDTKGYITINGTKHSLDGKGFNANTTTTLYEDTVTITHNSDGSKKVTVSYSFNTKTTLGTYTDSKDVTLTTIPRATTISCSGGTIGGSATITLARKSTAFYHKLYYKMSGQSSSTLIASGVAASSYSWSIPTTSFYSLIPNATKLTGTLYCYTYSNSACTTQIGSSQSCSVTVNTSESTCKPTVSLTLTTDSNTQNKTGNSTTVIKGYSTVTAASTVTAKNSASISSYKVTSGGVTKSNTASASFSKATSGSFTLTATDSRGYSNNTTKTLTLVNYINPDIAFAEAPSLDTDGKLTIKIKGNAFNGSFGAATNTVTCKYYYKLSSASTYTSGSFSLSKSGNTYTATKEITGLTYDKAYNVYCTITDTLHSTAISTNTVTVSSLPVFDWGESDFNFNVTVDVSQENFSGVRVYRKKNAQPAIRFDNQDGNGNRQTLGFLAHSKNPNGSLYRYDAEGSTNYEIMDSNNIAAKLLNLVYPVGSIYMSVNSTSPQSFIGGTWERIKGRFLFAGNDTDAPKVGDTGGESTHTLTTSEIPAHTHTAKGRSVYTGGGSYIALSSTSTGTTDYNINSGGGSGKAHNNMPPYLAVYMWKRTA